METPVFTPAERDALAALLDDPSASVRRALADRFVARPEAARALLVALAEGKDRALAWHARRFLEELRLGDPTEDFRVFIRSLHYELETGSVLLARVALPDADATACAAELDRLAARCRELIAEPASVREHCRVINRVLYHEAGFRGNTEHYGDPLNSFLPAVLARRKGIPISLGVVYLLVARRLGVELEPVGMPGHFLVGCFTEPEPFYIDAFEQGAFRSAPELRLFLRAQGVPPSPGDLAPSPVREVLARCCRNLARHYAEAGDADRSRLFDGFIAEFEAACERHTA